MVLPLLALAFAPGIAISLYIYLKDQHEREPLWLLSISFVYGAVSTFVTYFISYPLDKVLILNHHDVVDQFINAFCKVAAIEEFSKFLFIRFLLYNNRNFNEPFDGIVYSVMVGMGFATVENIFYIYNYGFTTGLLRMFTAVPAHATFAVFMGYFLGKGKFIHHREWYYTLLAYLAAVFFHGIYDYFWFISFEPGVWLCAVASLLVALFLSRKAIHLHQQASPFISARQEEELE